MSLKIQQGQLVNGLNVAQAASYATIATQKHDPSTPIYGHMTRLVERLVDMALIELEQDKAVQEIDEPLPEPAPGDTVQ